MSAPQRTARISFSNSHCESLDTADLPMLALIFVRAAMPMPIGSSPFARWVLLAGITIRPRATSSRTNSGSSCSARATASISGVTWPARADSIWVMIQLHGPGETVQYRRVGRSRSNGKAWGTWQDFAASQSRGSRVGPAERSPTEEDRSRAKKSVKCCEMRGGAAALVPPYQIAVGGVGPQDAPS